MTGTHWTSPSAYITDEAAGFDDALIDHATRRMRRAFDMTSSQLDRAHAETGCPRARMRIAITMDAMTAAVATDDVLRSILAAARPVRISDTLHDLCALNSGSPFAGGSAIELTLAGDAELSCAEPHTAWVIAAAAVEMLEEAAAGQQLRLEADLRSGRLRLTVVGTAARPPKAGTAPPSAFLGRLAALLGATVQRRQVGQKSMVRLAIPTRGAAMPDEAAPE